MFIIFDNDFLKPSNISIYQKYNYEYIRFLKTRIIFLSFDIWYTYGRLLEKGSFAELKDYFENFKLFFFETEDITTITI